MFKNGPVYYIHKYSFKRYEGLNSTLYFNRRRLNRRDDIVNGIYVNYFTIVKFYIKEVNV